jgi:hypothetical protein
MSHEQEGGAQRRPARPREKEDQDMPKVLEAEILTFEREKSNLLGQASGQFVLIKGDRVIDTFVSEDDALREGYRQFGRETFLVKQIVEFEPPASSTSFLISI